MKKYEFIESYIEGTHGFLIRDDEEKKPLIRCKDCKYWEHTPQNTTSYWKPCDEIKTEPHYFCWCGERRTDDKV